tara:strand:- start:571 stop:924 length:354 start_codon:yes stop_codon:yes gene_type:complete
MRFKDCRQKRLTWEETLALYRYFHVSPVEPERFTELKPNEFSSTRHLPELGMFVTTVEFIGRWAGYVLEDGFGYLYGISKEDLPENYVIEEGIDGFETGDIRIVRDEPLPVTFIRAI